MDPEALHIGPAEIYVGGTLPASGEAVSVTAGVPSTGGTNVGFTEGDALFKVAQNLVKVGAQQALGNVKVKKTFEEPSIEFEMKEIDLEKMINVMNGGVLTIDEVSTPNKTTITGGGDAIVATKVITLVSEQDDGGYLIACLYAGYVDSDTEIPFNKDKESTLKVKLSGLTLMSRAKGDRTHQLVRQMPTE